MTRRPLASRLLTAVLALSLALLAPSSRGQQQAAPAAPAAPRAIAPEPIWDAGIVARGAKVAHEFTLRNDGVEMLQLREVRPSCGCTVVAYDAAIPPGGSGKVRVELDSEGLSGAVAKDVTVFTNDAQNPAIQLTVRATIRAALDVQPGYFRFVHVVGAPPETDRQVLWSGDYPEVKVLAVESPSPSLAVSFRPAKPEERETMGRGNQWIVEATLASEPPTGPLTGDVLVKTDHPRKPVLAVPVAGYVRPVVMVTPPTADFGSFTGGQPRKGSVLITNYGAAPLRLLGVTTDVRGLTARIDEREKGKRFDLALTLSADAPKGPIAGALRVRTSSPKQPLLEVPVKGEVR